MNTDKSNSGLFFMSFFLACLATPRYHRSEHFRSTECLCVCLSAMRSEYLCYSFIWNGKMLAVTLNNPLHLH